jgi:YD repeat-containing protein
MRPAAVGDDFKTGRVNWTIQSSGAEILSIMLTAVHWLTEEYKIPARFILSIHDEIWFMTPERYAEQFAVLFQIAHMYTWSLFHSALDIPDLPLSRAYFSSVAIDDRLRKSPKEKTVTLSNPKGETETYAYNSNGWRTSVTNGRGKTRMYQFTPRGEAKKLTMPDGAVEEWSFNGTGQTTAYTSPLNYVINYVYDDAGKQTTVDYPTGTDTVLSYDNAGRRTSMLDSTGTSTWTLDAASQITQLVTPQGTQCGYIDNIWIGWINLNGCNTICFFQTHFCPILSAIIGFIDSVTNRNTISCPCFSGSHPIGIVRITWINSYSANRLTIIIENGVELNPSIL